MAILEECGTATRVSIDTYISCSALQITRGAFLAFMTYQPPLIDCAEGMGRSEALPASNGSERGSGYCSMDFIW